MRLLNSCPHFLIASWSFSVVRLLSSEFWTCIDEDGLRGPWYVTFSKKWTKPWRCIIAKHRLATGGFYFRGVWKGRRQGRLTGQCGCLGDDNLPIRQHNFNQVGFERGQGRGEEGRGARDKKTENVKNTPKMKDTDLTWTLCLLNFTWNKTLEGMTCSFDNNVMFALI